MTKGLHHHSSGSVHRRPRNYSSSSSHAGSVDSGIHASEVGDEPGINPNNPSSHSRYGGIHQECQIEVTDYSWDHYHTRTFGNADFIQFLGDHNNLAPRAEKQEFRVRWINVGGISWDVLSALALTYDLHSLALEDIINPQDRNNSKCDYFKKCLFLRVLCHTLQQQDPTNSAQSENTEGRQTAQDHPANLPQFWQWTKRDILSSVRDTEGPHKHRLRLPRLSRRLARRQRQLIIDRLKGSSVRVQLTPMFVFLLRSEDCVISIHPVPDLKLTQPIMNRLNNSDSGLRTSTDASLLVQSLLDLVVDLALEIVEEYDDNMTQLEQDVLFKPTMSTTKRLHILSGDIHHLKRTLEPLQTMIAGLRTQDTERTIAASLGYDMAKGRPRDDSFTPPHERPQGYMSYRTTIYLGDVHDHINFAIQSLETFAGAADHLIDFAFNMASYDMNTTMKQLTLASIIFLPLTLLTGYFGMNFDRMSSVQQHSESLFWIIALPVMGVLIPAFTHAEIIRAARAVYNRLTLGRMVARAEPEHTSTPAPPHIT